MNLARNEDETIRRLKSETEKSDMNIRLGPKGERWRMAKKDERPEWARSTG